jgi:beta-mannosidase
VIDAIDLDGAWRLAHSDGRRNRFGYAHLPDDDDRDWLDAIVPGEVHLDLMRAGVIGDPALGLNSRDSRWVEECFWHYRRAFDVPEIADGDRAWLTFEQLDLDAIIHLNGVEVGRHANAFRPCRIEVTEHVRAGSNLLAVQVEAGLYRAAAKPNEPYVMELDQRLHKRHWLRKPQYQFGWDWATRCVNVGIGGSVRLEVGQAPARVDALVPIASVSADLLTGTVDVRLHVEGLVTGRVTGTLVATLPDDGVSVTEDVVIEPGEQELRTRLVVHDPRLWWPVGQGAPELSRLEVRLVVDGAVVDERSTRVGFRRVVVNQEPLEEGRRFAIEVNNRFVFCKGGNLVPADMLPARIDRARYETLVDRALEANFTMLRVWGGGLYESDDFYELCDERGLLVWQELIFACSRYPGDDPGFVDDVRAEAVHQVRRLASHPSLVVWCGNNEIHWLAGPERDKSPDVELFQKVLPSIVEQEDGSRFYQPSSPWSPDDSDPNDDLVGDQHPWSVGFHNNDFRLYREMRSRFPNEGGVLGSVSLPTMLACLPEGQEHVGSPAWRLHDNSVNQQANVGWADNTLALWAGIDASTLTVEELTYWAGLLQGEGLREYCEGFRRRSPDTAAAIFWMYNDCWPTTRSWTIVDYFLRRTPSFHPVRRALAPVHVAVAVEGDEVVVYGLNDTPDTVEGELRFGLFDLAGGMPEDLRVPARLAPSCSTRLASFPLSTWADPTSTIAFAILERPDAEPVRSRLVLPLFKELSWAPANLEARVEGGRAIFESDVFVWGVCLDLAGEGDVPDNFFDVYPGVPVSLPWTSATPPTVLRVGNLAPRERT